MILKSVRGLQAVRSHPPCEAPTYRTQGCQQGLTAKTKQICGPSLDDRIHVRLGAKKCTVKNTDCFALVTPIRSDKACIA